MYYYPTRTEASVTIEKIYTVHYYGYRKTFSFSGEKHDFWELMYIDKGEVLTRADDRKFVLRQNQLTLFAPNEFHDLHVHGAKAANVVVVSFECHNEALKALSGGTFYINEYERSLLVGIIREAKKAYSTDLANARYRKLQKRKVSPPGTEEYASEQMLNCYLQILLIDLLRGGGCDNRISSSMTIRENEQKARIVLLTEWIDEHIDNIFTIDDLCGESMLSKSALERMFRDYTGMSPIQYCRYRKIEAAKRFMDEGKLNISQISERLGFSSVHYFSRTFRQFEEISPSEYKRDKQ